MSWSTKLRFQLRLDEETRIALSRLALAEERSASAQLRHMIRTEAQKRGLWTPSLRPVSVQRKP
jgi:hypothetical protein